MTTKTQPSSKEEFNEFVAEIESQPNYRKPIAFGICRVDRGQLNPGKILQAIFPLVNFEENYKSFAIFCDTAKKSGQKLDFTQSEWNIPVDEIFLNSALASFSPFIDETGGDKHKNIQVLQEIVKKNEQNSLYHKSLTRFFDDAKDLPKEIQEFINKEKENTIFFFTAIFDDVDVESVQAAYLKLYLLSLGKVPIRSLNLKGVFGILHNCAWSGNIPYELDYLREKEISWKVSGAYPTIDFVDKFPRFLSHVIPADNTRILETSKVRFGAQLAPAGTTIMPGASYVNFNAGTTGPVMVEGRISSSAIVGANSDVGGGASILGVLSGADGIPVTIGENCLLGANSVTGFALGNGCIVDAGVAVLAGTKFYFSHEEQLKVNDVNPDSNFLCFEHTSKRESCEIVKGSEISGLNGLHFRQDSKNGAMTIRRSTREVKLNSDLH